MLFINLDAYNIDLSTTQIVSSLIIIVGKTFPSGVFKMDQNIQKNTFSMFQQQQQIDCYRKNSGNLRNMDNT